MLDLQFHPLPLDPCFIPPESTKAMLVLTLLDSVDFSMEHCRLSIGRMRGDLIHLEGLAGRHLKKSGGERNRLP